ncbi:MAG TPA: class I SAM-dependent methyltransferase [Actinomycetota bacterium]|nr:class I SAM-dependent methyltransferase [Actinomycetota bacterium]
MYDLMYPQPSGPGTRAEFYADMAESQAGPVLELACGTGPLLLPIALRGIPCEGVDLSNEMLIEAQAKLAASNARASLRTGDMADFDLGRRFRFIFIASNSLLHLHATDDILRCFRSVRRHLDGGGRFAFDIFNPSVQVLARADGARREMQRFDDPERGEVRVDIEERYDAAAQVTRVVLYFSTEKDPDFLVTPLEMRSIFPQELLFLLKAGGLRLLERYGDFTGTPFTGEAPQQVCVCEAA